MVVIVLLPVLFWQSLRHANACHLPLYKAGFNGLFLALAKRERTPVHSLLSLLLYDYQFILVAFKELRTERKMTQKQLASVLNTTDDCIFFWEKSRSEPNIDEIIKIAEFFDVTTDYLLGAKDY